jgi:hypothetical protein
MRCQQRALPALLFFPSTIRLPGSVSYIISHAVSVGGGDCLLACFYGTELEWCCASLIFKFVCDEGSSDCNRAAVNPAIGDSDTLIGSTAVSAVLAVPCYSEIQLTFHDHVCGKTSFTSADDIRAGDDTFDSSDKALLHARRY